MMPTGSSTDGPAAPISAPTEQQLALALAAAMRVAITTLRAEHPESFYYITLVTSGEALAPEMSAWSREALARVAAEHGEATAEKLKWSYADSPYLGFGADAFDEVRRLFDLRPDTLRLEGPPYFDECALRLRAMEAAVSALDQEGLFGTGAARCAVVVNAEVMPPDATNTERALRLNPPAALEAWLREAAVREQPGGSRPGLDHVARERLRRALHESGAGQLAAIAAFTTADELHQFALNYNVNDGLSPVRALLAHPACDHGTALYVYWLFEDAHDMPTDPALDPEFDVPSLLAELVARLRAGTFVSCEIHVDPAQDLTKVQIYKLRKAGRDEFLRAVGTRTIERIGY